MNPEMLARATHRMTVKIAGMISRSIVRSSSLNKDKEQQLKIEAFSEETLEDVEVFQEYGFASSIPDGTEGIVVFIGGDRSHPAVIGTKGKVPDLAKGEVAIYHPNGAIVKLTSEGVVISSGNGNPIQITGDLKVTGDVKFGPNASFSINDLRTKYNLHTHSGNGLATESQA